MRDPKRIPAVIRSLEAVWMAYPDMRLCQLLAAIHVMDDPFYLEDDKLLVAIRQFASVDRFVPTESGKALLGSGG